MLDFLRNPTMKNFNKCTGNRDYTKTLTEKQQEYVHPIRLFNKYKPVNLIYQYLTELHLLSHEMSAKLCDTFTKQLFDLTETRRAYPKAKSFLSKKARDLISLKETETISVVVCIIDHQDSAFKRDIMAEVLNDRSVKLWVFYHLNKLFVAVCDEETREMQDLYTLQIKSMEVHDSTIYEVEILKAI